jgi:hypothetical protein
MTNQADIRVSKLVRKLDQQGQELHQIEAQLQIGRHKRPMAEQKASGLHGRLRQLQAMLVGRL